MNRFGIFLITFFISTTTIAQTSFQKAIAIESSDTLVIPHVISALSTDATVLGGSVLTLNASVAISELRPFLIKMSDNGTLVWSKIYRTGSGNFFPENMDVSPLEEGNSVALVVGSASSAQNSGQSFLVKMDEDGRKRWDVRLPGIVTSNIAPKPDQSLLMSIPVRPQSMQRGLLCLDEVGDFRWAMNLNVDWISRIEPTTDGGSLAISFRASQPLINDIYNTVEEGLISKFDETGAVLWTKVFNAFFPLDIKELPNGELIATGFTKSDQRLRVAKLSQTGSLLWLKKFEVDNFSRAGNLLLTNDSEFVVYVAASDKSHLLKVNSLGDLLWAKAFQGSLHDDFGKPLAQSLTGNFQLSLFSPQQSSAIASLTDRGQIEGCYNQNVCLESSEEVLSVKEDTLIATAVNVEVFATNGRLVNFGTTLSNFCNPLDEPIAFFNVPDTVCVESEVEIMEVTKDDFDQIEWIFEGASPDTASGPIPPTLFFEESGTFDLQLLTAIGACPDTFIQTITIKEAAPFEIGPDTTLCDPTPFAWDVRTSDYRTYAWDDGVTGGNRIIEQSGSYQVIVSDGFCENSDAREIQFLSDVLTGEPIRLNISDTSICRQLGVPLTVALADAIAENDWTWENGSNSSERFITRGGLYEVTAFIDACMFTDSVRITVEDCAGVLFAPNVFSPNGDDLNDLFLPEGKDLEVQSIKIYDRWGTLIFESLGEGWDGTINGKNAPTGTYAYVVTYQELVFEGESVAYGSVSIVR